MTTASKVLLTVFGSVALAIAGAAIYSGAYGLLVLSFAVLMGARALIAGNVSGSRFPSLEGEGMCQERSEPLTSLPLSDSRNPIGYTHLASPQNPINIRPH
ncbi:MAG: hypothetical protein KAG72_10300 [Abyssibacter sp.]|nr:hypothetical protein [Abyssibacter sp.]MCK5859725.1 hypothetical protein [Abyssibacter sp.]